ncbi:MAG: DoxX family protein [Reichenbachiella sp.]
MFFKRTLYYLPRVLAAIILLQTLFFKFGIGGDTALNQSKELFSLLSTSLLGSSEYESYIRISTGVLEFIASILLFIPSKALYGGLLGILLMTGAIFSHVFAIGIAFNNDGGQLLIMAVIVLICCLKVVFDEKKKVKELLTKFT